MNYVLVFSTLWPEKTNLGDSPSNYPLGNLTGGLPASCLDLATVIPVRLPLLECPKDNDPWASAVDLSTISRTWLFHLRSYEPKNI